LNPERFASLQLVSMTGFAASQLQSQSRCCGNNPVACARSEKFNFTDWASVVAARDARSF